MNCENKISLGPSVAQQDRAMARLRARQAMLAKKSDDAFMAIVERIVSTRSQWHWKHGGLVHLQGRGPDGKTECGLKMNLSEVYGMLPGHSEAVTCKRCDELAPAAFDETSGSS